jgi:hypothetical protein
MIVRAAHAASMIDATRRASSRVGTPRVTVVVVASRRAVIPVMLGCAAESSAGTVHAPRSAHESIDERDGGGCEADRDRECNVGSANRKD